MAKRKAISKRLRFEVFKRDKFTCQYCGKSAPDVVLEVDHIKPVAKDGTNDIMNLITSCKDCNRGKSDKELSDDSVVKKQQRQIKELSERREQLEIMLEWRESLRSVKEDCVRKLADTFCDITGFSVNEHGIRCINRWIKEFSAEEILDAMDIAVDRYFNGSNESCEVAFNKIPGICHNRKIQQTDNRCYYYNYIVKAMDINGWHCNKSDVREFVYSGINDDYCFELVKSCLRRAHNWTTFWEQVADTFDYFR